MQERYGEKDEFRAVSLDAMQRNMTRCYHKHKLRYTQKSFSARSRIQAVCNCAEELYSTSRASPSEITASTKIAPFSSRKLK